MSWLNFNESLNNIKGQLSSFASGVLAEEIVDETEDDVSTTKHKIEDVEGQQEAHSIELHKPSEDVVSEDGNNWTWEPPGGEPPTITDNLTFNLQKKIEILENEKKELIANLEQLDSDYQQTTDKIISLKDHLQVDYNDLKADFEKLQREYGEVLNENMEKSKKIEFLKSENFKGPGDCDQERFRSLHEENQTLNKRLMESQSELADHAEVLQKFEDLKKEFENYKRSSENKKVNAEELQRLCKKLEKENASLCAKIQGSQVENTQNSESIAGQDVIRKLEDTNINLIRESEALSLKLQVLMHENEELQNVNEKLKNDYQVLRCEGEKLKAAVEELQNYSEELKNSNINIENEYQKLKHENKKLNSDHSDLLGDHEKLKANYEIVKNNSEISKKECEQLKHENKTLSHIYEELKISSDKLKNDLEKLMNVNAEVKKEYENLKNEHEKLTPEDDTLNLRKDFENLKASHEKLIKEKEVVHEKYISIITENMQKYMDSNTEVDSKISPLFPEEQPQILEFAGKVETLLKLLLDFKGKTETLEKELCEVTQEKNKTIAEKNFEIEKLLQNSEILSQEVITKSQAIKDYEEECAELMKNNDLLISELQNYKNTSGLQTISESNEDNMLLLESQLENANKKIQDMELIINDLENSKQETNLETQTELEYIKKQLNMTGQELSHSKEEYQQLFVQYKQLEDDKHILKSALDKIKVDYENIEYKYTEINVSMETLKEENEDHRNKIADLDVNSKKLESLNFNLESKIELLQNVVDDFKQKLELEVENTKQKEMQIRNLVERLQNSKMCETGLKLQVDTIYKELQSVSEVKQTLEFKYNQTLSKLEELQNDLEKTKEECTLLRTRKGETEENLEISNVEESLEEKLRILNQEISASNSKMVELQTQFENIQIEKQTVQSECTDIKAAYSQVNHSNMELQHKLCFLEAQLTDLTKSRNELITLVTAKHQENVQYHEEIQRLSNFLTAETEKAHLLEIKLQDLSTQPSPNDLYTSVEELSHKNEEIEKLTDQNTFLREKCEVLAQNLLQEQSNLQKVLSERLSASDKEQALAKELERLRAHLVEIEEMYTQELLQAEQKNKEMQAKVNEIEQREKDSSSIYTSVSIRANQQVETLQAQLQLVTNQRDELRIKISDIEDENNKHVAALTNLQLVLEQFQKDKEKDVYQETERVRRQITTEKKVQQELQVDINNLKVQLDESKQGLQAASRLSDQLEKCKQQIVSLKDEVSKLQDQLRKSEAKYKDLSTQTDSKVDKTLIRNLIIGYISSNANDQNRILKIIATVLDFNQKESDKVKLDKPQQGGWLSSILHPQSLSSNQEVTQQSLSEAFVRFLENESKPKVLPNLLTSNQPNKMDSSNGSTSSTPRQSPLVLSEVVLPTFADFGKSRNSSSILKDVLKDNT